MRPPLFTIHDLRLRPAQNDSRRQPGRRGGVPGRLHQAQTTEEKLPAKSCGHHGNEENGPRIRVERIKSIRHSPHRRLLGSATASVPVIEQVQVGPQGPLGCGPIDLVREMNVPAVIGEGKLREEGRSERQLHAAGGHLVLVREEGLSADVVPAACHVGHGPQLMNGGIVRQQGGLDGPHPLQGDVVVGTAAAGELPSVLLPDPRDEVPREVERVRE